MIVHHHHYAPCNYLPRIVASGFLQPFADNIAVGRELPLLWFSANQKWEPTATKALGSVGGSIRSMTMDEQLERIGCCRFSIPANDTRLMPWVKACRFAGIGYTAQRKMEAVGRRRGARPTDWFAVAEAVPLSELAFSIFDGRKWEEANLADKAREWEGRDFLRQYPASELTA